MKHTTKLQNLTLVELHMNKKPKRAWEDWLNFSQSISKINYERKLEMAKENILRKEKNRASHIK